MSGMCGRKPRICIIGAGPSGMSALYCIKLLGDQSPDVECYETQETWGGQWNYTWRTGTDEYGELVNNSMYRNLWSIGAKEVMEFSDYTFKDHFGKLLPSYVPRDIIGQYLHGRWTRGRCGDMTSYVHFRHVIRSVDYRDDSDDFLVRIRNLPGNTDLTEVFTHVIVANGKYTVPATPSFPGLETFPGLVVHSHEFRDARAFKDKTVLIIGGRFSAGDIAIQLFKFGAKHVICSSKRGTLDIDWPTYVIEDRQLVEKFENGTAVFKDGSRADVDSVIFCTGYMYHQPFLAENLRFSPKLHTNLFPDHLYKGIVWTKAGNNKLLFIGACEEYTNFTLFDVQSEWACQYILGKLQDEPVSSEKMLQYVTEWQEQVKLVRSFDGDKIFEFQVKYAHDLCRDIDYPVKYFDSAHEHLKRIFSSIKNNIATYRDLSFPSIFTGDWAPEHHKPWLQCKDDTLEDFLGQD